MSNEGEHYARWVDLLTTEILKTLDGLPEEAVNWRPPMPDTNTIYAIGTHVVGSTRWWLNKAAGREIERDRSAEFRAEGSLASLREALQANARESRSLLTSLPASAFEAPRQVTMGGQPQQWSGRECVLHTIEHMATHLGHLQLTRQLWEAKGGTP